MTCGFVQTATVEAIKFGFLHFFKTNSIASMKKKVIHVR